MHVTCACFWAGDNIWLYAYSGSYVLLMFLSRVCLSVPKQGMNALTGAYS